MIDRVFDTEMAGLIERLYAVSWYADIDRVSPDRICGRKDVPVPNGEELVAAMRENVEEARWNRDGIRKRYEQAQRDGLFDVRRVEDVSPETSTKWLAAVEMMKGDRARCIAELKHWREYVNWALEQRRATQADTRLPPERDDDGAMRSDVQDAERPDHPDQQPGAGGVRYGDVQDGKVP